MALNYPGPAQLRVFYTVQGREHVMRLNFNPSFPLESGQPYSEIKPYTRSGANVIGLDTHEDNLVNAMKPYFASVDASISRSEVWKFEPNSFDATFMTGRTLGVAGTSGNITRPASEIIFTMRTQEGGIMKFHLLETIYSSGVTVAPPYASVNLPMGNELIGDSKIWLARDTSYPIAHIAIHPGQNERLFRQIYR